MSKYPFKKALLLTLTASLLSLGISGCSTVQDGLDKIRSLSPASVSEGTESGPKTNVNASNPENTVNGISEIDHTPPVIEAEDLTIPYGTFLHLEDAASIYDDRDSSLLCRNRQRKRSTCLKHPDDSSNTLYKVRMRRLEISFN